MIDRLRFETACRTVTSGGRLQKGIGTKSERSVHAVLKNYFEPYHDSQEQKVGSYIADIVGESGIIEIQTASFSHLRGKLAEFLPISRVTVVYPVYVKKVIVTLDGDTGEVKSRRTSPLLKARHMIFLRSFSPYLNFCCMKISASLSCCLKRTSFVSHPKASVGKRTGEAGFPSATVSPQRLLMK